MTEKGISYGFCSNTQAQKGGFCVYLNEKGDKVSVTLVHPTMDASKYDAHGDLVYVGVVTKFVGRVPVMSKFESGIG